MTQITTALNSSLYIPSETFITLLSNSLPETPAVCIGCGCDDYHACIDLELHRPCHWLVVDRKIGKGVCSSCPEELERWRESYKSARTIG